jgi:hypothetical protein
VSIGKGRTQLEARIDKDVQFLVACDELDMQTPNGQVHAAGNVTVSGPNMEGACSKLTLTWIDERLYLEGNVTLKCKQDGQDVDLAGEQLSVKLAVVETAPAPARAE